MEAAGAPVPEKCLDADFLRLFGDDIDILATAMVKKKSNDDDDDDVEAPPLRLKRQRVGAKDPEGSESSDAVSDEGDEQNNRPQSASNIPVDQKKLLRWGASPPLAYIRCPDERLAPQTD